MIDFVVVSTPYLGHFILYYAVCIAAVLVKDGIGNDVLYACVMVVSFAEKYLAACSIVVLLLLFFL